MRAQWPILDAHRGLKGFSERVLQAREGCDSNPILHRNFRHAHLLNGVLPWRGRFELPARGNRYER